jgi:BirA family transcriptional regulator, biotin operon repressor / biotin---[acetyl-CoA-carboxylase] ligase
MAVYELSRLRRDLKPLRVHFFTTLRSTNSHAAWLRKQGKLFAPAVVLTSRQTSGRGRGGNSWFSTAGCLTVTFVFPVEEHLEPHQLPLIAGLAVRNAAAELTGEAGIQLKWPNDLMFEGKKLAGLLCERVDKVDLIGLGLNVNVGRKNLPAALRDSATSLSQIAGGRFDLTGVLVEVAHHLRRTLQSRTSHTFAAFRAEYDQHHALPGKMITIVDGQESPLRGRCVGIDDAGRLLVKGKRNTHRVLAGHVALTESR